jgi:hypothetical protein
MLSEQLRFSFAPVNSCRYVPAQLLCDQCFFFLPSREKLIKTALQLFSKDSICSKAPMLSLPMISRTHEKVCFAYSRDVIHQKTVLQHLMREF